MSGGGSAAPDPGVPDPGVLADWLAAAGFDLGRPVAVTRLAGGSSNLTYAVTGPAGSTVLRRPPVRGALPTAHDMAREYRIQRALAASTVPVPRMLALAEDPAVIGAPFYLMERLDGVCHASADAVRALAPADAAAAGRALATTLADLHAVDPAGLGLADLIRPEPYAARQLRRWRAQWERSRTAGPGHPLDRLLDLLDARLPAQTATAVVHGDYNLANVMYRRDAPASVLAVLDWELWTVGDPLADVGQLLAYWGEAGRLLFAGRGGHLPDANPALPDRAGLLASYLGGREVGEEALAFYEVLALVKLAVIVAGSAQRAGDDEARAAGIRRMVDALSAVAGRLTTDRGW